MSAVSEMNKSLLMAVRTGKVTLGLKHTILALQSGKVRLIVAAANCPPPIMSKLKTQSELTEVPLYVYKGTGFDLGKVCGKPFPVSALAVHDPGDSGLLKLVKKDLGK